MWRGSKRGTVGRTWVCVGGVSGAQLTAIRRTTVQQRPRRRAGGAGRERGAAAKPKRARGRMGRQGGTPEKKANRGRGGGSHPTRGATVQRGYHAPPTHPRRAHAEGWRGAARKGGEPNLPEVGFCVKRFRESKKPNSKIGFLQFLNSLGFRCRVRSKVLGGFLCGWVRRGGSAVRVAVRVGVLRQEVGLLPGSVAAAGGRCGLEPGVGSPGFECHSAVGGAGGQQQLLSTPVPRRGKMDGAVLARVCAVRGARWARAGPARLPPRVAEAAQRIFTPPTTARPPPSPPTQINHQPPARSKVLHPAPWTYAKHPDRR